VGEHNADGVMHGISSALAPGVAIHIPNTRWKPATLDWYPNTPPPLLGAEIWSDQGG
jgi:hypothetical protein